MLLNTILGMLWRALACLLDWRTILRKISGRPIVDVAFVTNIRDEIDVKRFLGTWIPPLGHFNGPRYWLKGIAGRTRPIYSLTEDVLRSGNGSRRNAQKQFIEATQWAIENGAGIVLLAAATKRLFGEEGAVLKVRFPRICFSIGDNGTAFLLEETITLAFSKVGLKPKFCRVAVIGLGYLGEQTVKFLKREGYQNIVLVTSIVDVAKELDVQICSSIEEIGEVDTVIACAHKAGVRLTAENIELIRRKDRRLLIIDVCEPPNLRRREFEKCKDVVLRLDAGNAYSPQLKSVLGIITDRMFRLDRGIIFGCFAEAIALAAALRRGDSWVREINWFVVSEKNMEIVKKLFEPLGFTIPAPRCFGRPVKSLTLDLIREKRQQPTRNRWKWAWNKIQILF